MALNDTNKNTSDFANLTGNIPGMGTQPNPFAEAAAAINTAQPTQPQPTFTGAAPQAHFEPAVNTIAAQNQSKVGTGLLANQRRLVPYNQIGARVGAFMAELEKLAKMEPDLHQDKNNWEFKSFDGPSNRSAVSAILFIREYQSHVAVYPWIVQDQDNELADKVVQIPAMFGQAPTTVNLPQLTEELLTSDDALTKQITAFVASASRYAGKQVFVTGGRVLPTKLEPTNTAQLRSILFYASDALENAMIQLDPNHERFTIAQKSQNENLVAKMEFNPGLSATAVGLPVRNDLSVKLTVTEKAVRNSLAASRQAPFSTTRVFAELIYTGGNMQMAQQMQQMAMMMQGGMPMAPMGLNPMFRPAIIISSIDNQFAGASLETQLLALNSASLLITNNNWMNLFRPNHAITGVGDDPRDIGMITADVNYPGEQLQYTETKVDTFPFYQYMAKYIERDPLIKLDVPELGDLTYLQRPFIFASGASGESGDIARANNMIATAASYLTNGTFNRHWDGNQPIVVDSDRIEVGYYIDDKGELRPLSEIDYLSLINRVSVEVGRAYQDSFNKEMYPDEMVRFSKRKAIYDTYYPGAYEITGYARRLTINSAFIVALSKAMNDAGATIGIEYSYNTGATVERGYRNQILGVQADQIQQFVYGNVFNYGNAQNPQSGVWRTYQPNQFGGAYL